MSSGGWVGYGTCVHGIAWSSPCALCGRVHPEMALPSSAAFPPPLVPTATEVRYPGQDNDGKTISRLQYYLREAVQRSRSWKRRFKRLEKVHKATVFNLRVQRALSRQPADPVVELRFFDEVE